MEEKEHQIIERHYHLASRKSCPFPIEIQIMDDSPGGSSGRTFIIAGENSTTGYIETREYYLEDSDHHSYLDFFEKLSHDFGLRVPRNRSQINVEPNFNTKFQEILTENIVPDMLYGYGDPAVIHVKGYDPTANDTYYLLSTSNDAPDSFPIIRSENLTDWEFVSFVFPKGNKPLWAADGEFVSDYWAPEMHKVRNEFRVYFVARDKVTHELCIGMAKSSQPEGPFSAGEEPILKNNVIDPHVYVENDQTVFLYWKEDNNAVWPYKLNELLHVHPELISAIFQSLEDQRTACLLHTLWPWTKSLEPMERFLVQQILIEVIISDFAGYYDRLSQLAVNHSNEMNETIRSVLQYMRTPVYAQQLSDDGSALTGRRTKIIENDLAWEAHLVEGMWVSKQNGKYYLFYTGNDFSTDQYGIGVAIGESPLGPFHKLPKQLLQTTSRWSAPGHPCVVSDADGKQKLFFHGYFPGKAGYKQFRALLSSAILFEDDRVILNQKV